MTSRFHDSKSDGNRGFTLVEVLVALTVMALIISYLVSGVAISRRAWERARQIDEIASTSAVHDYIRQILSQVYRPRSESEVSPTQFVGAPDGMTFIAVGSTLITKGGLYRFDLRRDDQGDLKLRQRMHRRSDAETELPQYERALLHNVQSITARYFGSPRLSEARAWQSSWTSLDNLPELVSLELSFRQGDKRTWAPLVVELKLRD